MITAAFDAKIERGPGCWEWTGRKGQGGYGRYGGKLAHRIAWELERGPIPGELTIDHTCKNPGCVNVAHMRLLTLSANASDNKWRDRTECINGHEWTPENTHTRTRGPYSYRVCRACDRVRHRELAERRKVEIQ